MSKSNLLSYLGEASRGRVVDYKTIVSRRLSGHSPLIITTKSIVIILTIISISVVVATPVVITTSVVVATTVVVAIVAVAPIVGILVGVVIVVLILVVRVGEARSISLVVVLISDG